MKLKLLLAALLLAVTAPIASAQTQPFAYYNNALAPTGTLANSPVRMVTNATIRVCNEPASGTPCTPLATIYSDPALTVPLANPFQADFYGNYVFYVPAGTYHVQQSGPQVAVTDIPYIVFGVGGGGGGNITFEHNGVTVATEPTYNMVDTATAVWTVTDDPTNTRVNAQILASGGGGGGVCPYGSLYDIQINDPLGSCGSDPGIGQIVPSLHTIYENILNANQQVDVSDATHSGLICQGHSNGSSIDSVYCTVPSATFSTANNGYATFPPDAAPTNVGDVATISSLTTVPLTTAYGTVQAYPMQFQHSVSGLVSLEFLYPLDSTNAPSPTTSSDLVRTLFLQPVNSVFAGNVVPTDPASAHVQDKICTIDSVAAMDCTFDSPVTPGNSIYAISVVQCGAGCSGQTITITDTNGYSPDSFTSSYFADGSGSTFPMRGAYSSAVAGGVTTVHVSPSAPGADYSVQVQIFELLGAISPDGTSSNNQYAAPPAIFNAVTTGGGPDVIIATQTSNNNADTFSPGTGYVMLQQLNGVARFAAIGSEIQNQAGSGTFTPTITLNTIAGAHNNASIAQAFRITLPGSATKPFFRFLRYQDFIPGGDWPVLTSGVGKCFSTDGTVVNFVACSTSLGTVTNVSGTTNQIDVATGTSTPVVSLDGQFTSVNYATCTNTADALTVTLTPAPTALVTGLTVQCKVSGANTTTTPTLKVGALTAHTIVKGGSAGQATLVANDLLTNMVARFTYDAGTTTWELQNPQQGGSGTGTVTNIATTAPLGGGPITTTGTLTCTTCVVASSPGAGLARFAGGTQTVTSSELSGDATTGGSNAVTVGNLSNVTNHSLPNTGLAIPGTFQAGFPSISTGQTAFAIVSNSMTFGADFASISGIASSVKCGTSPSGSVTFTLLDVTTSTTLGTIVVSSSCVGTFATTSHATQAVTANDLLNLNSGTDATAANIAFNLRATRN